MKQVKAGVLSAAPQLYFGSTGGATFGQGHLDFRCVGVKVSVLLLLSAALSASIVPGFYVDDRHLNLANS